MAFRHFAKYRNEIFMSKKKRRNGGRFSVITSCISTSMVLILLGAMVFFVTMANNLSRKVKEELPVAVLLDDNISEQELQAFQTELREKPYVQSLTYISKEQGAKETLSGMGLQQNDFLEANPILAELELLLVADYANKDSIATIEPALKQRHYVAEVIYPIEEIDRINRVIPIVSSILLGIALLLGCVSFALINNTIQMSVYARRFTIYSMKLIGAKWSFIRRPFMVQAFWVGLSSALIASGIIGGGIYSILQVDVYIAQLITPRVLAFTFGSIFICGLFLTLFCAYFSVGRFLRMKASEIFMK